MMYTKTYAKSVMAFNTKCVLAFVLFMLLVSVSWAQKNKFSPEIKLTTASNTTNYKIPGKQFYPIYIPRGSQFYDDNWETGSVVLINGDVYTNLHLKYNTVDDELIYLNTNNRRAITIDKDAVSEFVFDKRVKASQRFKKMEFDRIPKGDHYFEMLYEGRLQLVIFNRTMEEKTSPYKDRNGLLQVSDFVLRRNYYICFPDMHFEKVKLKRGSLLALFPDKKKELRKLLRKDKNSFRTNEEAIRATQLIETNFFLE
ncbi:hypothetical protein [Maribellus sediminis]|uniref:hypothetical protein n=1 Tax=Maribellus sediminis TaxID=2696285 RepID=UPI0014302FC8|nr:hypothetical protein [Maribellus sediminis]